MESMHFTDFGTVVLGTKEITIKEFLEVMEEKLDTSTYNIDYSDNGELVIRYDCCYYKVDLSLDEARNPLKYSYLNKLYELGRIEPKIDTSKYTKESLNTKLSIREKKKLISMFKKKRAKNSLENTKEYFENLKEDLVDVFDEFYYNDLLPINGYVSLILGVPCLVIAGTIVLAGGISPLWLLLGLSGVGISAVMDIGYFLFKYIPNRFERITDYFEWSKDYDDDERNIFKTKIKGLKKSILKDRLAKFKLIKDKNVVEMTKVSSSDGVEKYEYVDDEAEITDIDSMLAKLLYRSIQSLKQVDKLYRSELKQKLDDLLQKYQDLVAAKKSDVEIMSEITREWNDIDSKIEEAKHADASRYYMAQMLQDELDTIEVYPNATEDQNPLDSNHKLKGRKPFKGTSKN